MYSIYRIRGKNWNAWTLEMLWCFQSSHQVGISVWLDIFKFCDKILTNFLLPFFIDLFSDHFSFTQSHYSDCMWFSSYSRRTISTTCWPATSSFWKCLHWPICLALWLAHLCPVAFRTHHSTSASPKARVTKSNPSSTTSSRRTTSFAWSSL